MELRTFLRRLFSCISCLYESRKYAIFHERPTPYNDDTRLHGGGGGLYTCYGISPVRGGGTRKQIEVFRPFPSGRRLGHWSALLAQVHRTAVNCPCPLHKQLCNRSVDISVRTCVRATVYINSLFNYRRPTVVSERFKRINHRNGRIMWHLRTDNNHISVDIKIVYEILYYTILLSCTTSPGESLHAHSVRVS